MDKWFVKPGEKQRLAAKAKALREARANKKAAGNSSSSEGAPAEVQRGSVFAHRRQMKPTGDSSYFDDDDDDDPPAAPISVCGSISNSAEEVDPLDAFMAGVGETIQKEELAPKEHKEKPQYLDEQDDPIAALVEERRQAGEYHYFTHV
jgi:hypothetical protein